MSSKEHEAEQTTKCKHLRAAIFALVLNSFLISQVSATKSSTTSSQYDKEQHSTKWAISRKSIVFDIKTPKVFYCPQSKQADELRMIVKSVPLERLCEFKGDPKPRSSQSDCYNDVDESQFACEEKKRFMIRLDALESGFAGTIMDADNLNDPELEYHISHKASFTEKKSSNINKSHHQMVAGNQPSAFKKP